MDLWKEAREQIEATVSSSSPEFEHIEAIVRVFDEIDPKGNGFRYPLAKNGVGPSLSSDPLAINLASLQEAMVNLANFLDAVRMEMSVRLDMLSTSITAF